MNFKTTLFSVLLISLSATVINAQEVALQKTSLVGNGIVEFIPKGFDQSKTPSLILSSEPKSKGKVPANWTLVPEFLLKNNKASAVLKLQGNVSLYGGGEVTGPLLRN